MSEVAHTWIPFYSELADKLVPFQNDRAALIGRIRSVYDRIGVKLPKLELDNNIVDIDPFTVFGLFNKGISNATRLKLITEFKDEFGIETPIPSDFDGVPVLNNLRATFYHFVDSRGDSDIATLWEVFLAALDLAAHEGEAERSRFVSSFDRAITQRGIKWNLTMGLFWIRPYTFLNLDSRSRWYIADQRVLGDECSKCVLSYGGRVPDGEMYLHTCKLCLDAMGNGRAPDGCTDFPSLSRLAWVVSEHVNEEKAAQRAATSDLMAGARAIGDDAGRGVHYWAYSPGRFATKWGEFYSDDIMAIGWGEIGDPSTAESKSDIAQRLKDEFGGSSSQSNSALALWQFVHDMKPGDIVYAKEGQSKLVGRGVVTSDASYDDERTDEYKNVRSVEWTHKGSWDYDGRMATKTLTDITRYTEMVAEIESLFADGEAPLDCEVPEARPYTEEDFLSEVYLSEPAYQRLVSLLRHKKNVILQGAPGVGKTFMAKRLAYSMMGVRDASRVELVQFHQSYSYEDFIMGYRPTESGFELKTGAFYDFCRRAEDDDENDYFFIIDEINRGNLSKIFGELFMLIEPDKRGASMRLLYSDERFSVPANVYLIGTMNTADRSLALMDFALRRRFAFFELGPGFDSAGFRAYQESLNSSSFDSLIACVQQLNEAIADDDTLGEGYRIGHSFFCGLQPGEGVDAERLRSIVEYEIVPLLREYWFDDLEKASSWERLLKESISAR